MKIQPQWVVTPGKQTPVTGAVSFIEQKEGSCVLILSVAKIIKVLIIEEFKDINVLFQMIPDHFTL